MSVLSNSQQNRKCEEQSCTDDNIIVNSFQVA